MSPILLFFYYLTQGKQNFTENNPGGTIEFDYAMFDEEIVKTFLDLIHFIKV